MAKVTLGAGFDSIAGNFGGVVVANSRTGFTLRKPPRYRRPTSPGQRAAAERMALAAQAWNELTYDQARAWDNYARTQRRTNPTNGRTYSPTGFTAFCGLAIRVLHVDPAAEIPSAPPIHPMPVEGVQVEANGIDQGGEKFGEKRRTKNEKRNSETTADEQRNDEREIRSANGQWITANEPLPQSKIQNPFHPPAPSSFTSQNEEGVNPPLPPAGGVVPGGGRGEGDGGSGARSWATDSNSLPNRANLHPPAPSSCHQEEGENRIPAPSSLSKESEEGVIRFSASGPNAPGIATELLLQRLPNERRKPTGQYKTIGFHTFTADSLSVDIPIEPGIYVPAYAFIEPATGRTTAGIVLGMVEVGGNVLRASRLSTSGVR